MTKTFASQRILVVSPRLHIFSAFSVLISLAIGSEGMAQKLNANLSDGLTGKDFPERTAAFGNNFRDEVEAKTFCSIFLEALDDFMMKVLLVAATGSMIFGYLGADPSDYGHGK